MKRWILLSVMVPMFALSGRAWGNIYLPPGGLDQFPTSEWTFMVEPVSGNPQTLECSGPMTVRREDPSGGVIQTELLALDLVCPGGVTVRLNGASFGQTNSLGDSFFDVFFVIEGGALGRLHNISPFRMQARIGHVTPFGARYAGVDPIALYDDPIVFRATCTIPLISFGRPTKPETIGEESPVFSCFYECKPHRFTTNIWREVTTLMLVNQSMTTRIRANLFILDGNERVLVNTNFVLSPGDLDEINVCETINLAPMGVPQAGVVEVVLTDEFSNISVGGGAYGWVKNVVGAFVRGNPEPFSGFVAGVAKTECRLVGPNVVRPEEVMARLQGPLVPPRLIEGTMFDP